MSFQFLPTLPARGATLVTLNLNGKRSISTHAPREGSDRQLRHDGRQNGGFLPTLPARGATGGCLPRPRGHVHFYPRSPRGERL